MPPGPLHIMPGLDGRVRSGSGLAAVGPQEIQGVDGGSTTPLAFGRRDQACQFNIQPPSSCWASARRSR
jgi:hypothetical protein